MALLACLAIAIAQPCCVHSMAGHGIAIHMPCHAVRLLCTWPYLRHAAMPMPCPCHGPAMQAPCKRHASAMPPCTPPAMSNHASHRPVRDHKQTTIAYAPLPCAGTSGGSSAATSSPTSTRVRPSKWLLLLGWAVHDMLLRLLHGSLARHGVLLQHYSEIGLLLALAHRLACPPRSSLPHSTRHCFFSGTQTSRPL